MSISAHGGSAMADRRLDGADGSDRDAPLPAERLLALLDAVQAIADAAARPAQMSALVATLLRETAALLDGSACLALAEEPGGTTLRVHGGTGVLADWEGELLPTEGSLLGATLVAGRLPTRHGETGYPLERPLSDEAAIAAAVPGAEGPIGVLVLLPGVPGPQDARAQGLLERLARAGGAALGAAREFARARAVRGALDQWREHRAAEERLGELRRTVQGLGIEVLDVDAARGELIHRPLLGDPSRTDRGGAGIEEWAERAQLEDRPALLRLLQGGAEQSPLVVRLRSGPEGSCPVLLHVDPRNESGEHLRVTLVPLGGSADGPTECVDGDRGEGADARSREMVRTLRHQINNPLAIVAGEVQLLLRDPAIGEHPALERSVAAIHDAAQRLVDVMTQLAILERSSATAPITQPGTWRAEE